MSDPSEASAHLLRARRTAATARAALSIGAIALLAASPHLAADAALAAGGFSFIILTAVVQLLLPRADWLKVEESVAGVAGILIVGLGDQRVNVVTLLWLAAVASGVLARGGRVHWIGRAVIVCTLLLPIIRLGRVTLDHVGLCIGSLGLLLTCGRLTRELNHLLARARHDADHDGLTGALSRGAFRAALASATSIGDAALVLVDLDNFGEVNKARGHAAGDALLRALVERMRAAVGKSAPIGRLGGDEFATIVPVEDPEPTARALVVALGEGRGGIAASVGIAHAPYHGRDPEALLRAADVALRVAKRSGRGQVSTYAGETFGEDGPAGARAALERLILGEGIVMVVQPIVECTTGTVHAYEALARFRAGSTDSPLHWFALADEFGLRNELEIACLTAALGLLGSRPAGTRLSVNLSGLLLSDERVQRTLADQRDLSGLIVEVTEQALVHQDAGLRQAIDPLLARGAALAVDDMGVGYSGLRQITALRPGYLKLDRSLVRGIESDPDRAALLRALAGYAEHTGSQMVAEGVETAAELATVRSLGVPLIQGFYFGRPAPPWPAQRDGLGAAPLADPITLKLDGERCAGADPERHSI
ncbi:MAG: hypothetical protein NVSMB25_15240 [Thermoleophilaceae bacterium]